jgi:hypothetical protein
VPRCRPLPGCDQPVTLGECKADPAVCILPRIRVGGQCRACTAQYRSRPSGPPLLSSVATEPPPPRSCRGAGSRCRRPHEGPPLPAPTAHEQGSFRRLGGLLALAPECAILSAATPPTGHTLLARWRWDRRAGKGISETRVRLPSEPRGLSASLLDSEPRRPLDVAPHAGIGPYFQVSNSPVMPRDIMCAARL